MSHRVQLGPFEIGERVGEGGMGAVYRARHVETGEPVAVKVLLADVAREPEKRRDFQREVQALAKLHHPSIAGIVDYGEIGTDAVGPGPEAFVEGAPWFAMEYVDGEAMPKTAGDWEWETIESVLLSVLDALAHAHARSIVHRDLKPGNILVESAQHGEGPTVKLVDFGIARIFGTSEGANPGEWVTGTPKYMAPEQIFGDWRDQGPWTDLYALGCLTWRVVSGVAPFEGDTTEEVLEGHVQSPPPRFQPAMSVPRGLEAWLRRLLQKDVDLRTRQAADAAWELLQLGELRQVSDAGTSTGGSTAPTFGPQATLSALEETIVQSDRALSDRGESGGVGPRSGEGGEPGERGEVPPVLPNWEREPRDRRAAVLPEAGLELFDLREVPVVDREAERDRLWGTLRRVGEQGEPQLATLEAGAGTGKTRLAEWLCRRAHETGAAKVLRATHSRSSGPDSGLREMIRRAFRTSGLSRREVYERILESLPSRGIDDRAAKNDARALTELLRPSGDAEAVDGPRYRFSSATHKYAFVRRLLERLTVQRPLVVWFDDLQWGRGSIGVLEDLFDALREAPPVMAVATIRSDIVAEDPDLSERLHQLYERAEARRIELSPLAADDHRALIDRLLDLAPDLADELADRTEGNPLFAIQLLRNWVDRGVLEVAEAGFDLAEGVEIEVPEDIHRLWLERLARLVDDTASASGATVWIALELAAVLGRDVDADQWEMVLDDAGIERPLELVDRLVQRGLAERTTRGWTFTHGLLVESLRRRARDAERWRSHHRACAEMLESRLVDELGMRERLAEHWIEAGELERALEPLRNEVQLHLAVGSDDERGRLLERRTEILDELDAPEDDPRRLENLVEEAALTADTENLDRARSVLEDVWEISEEDQPRIRAMTAWQLGSVATRSGDREASKRWTQTALEASRRADADLLKCRCHRSLAWSYIYDADYERAERHVRRQIEIADRLGDQYLRLRGLRTKAWVYKGRGDERAGELYEEIRRESAEAGFVSMEARALNDLGEWARSAGDFEEAREYHRRHVQKFHELFRVLERGTGHLNLTQVEIQAGKFAEAMDHLERAESIWKEVGAEDRWAGLRSLVRLAHAAGVGDRIRCESIWESLDGEDRDDWRTFEDHGWMAETAAEYALEAGWEEFGRKLAEFAREIWTQIQNEEGARRIGAMLEEAFEGG